MTKEFILAVPLIWTGAISSGCSGLSRTDFEKWTIIFDVHQDERGACVVSFEAGQDLEVSNRDIKVDPRPN